MGIFVYYELSGILGAFATFSDPWVPFYCEVAEIRQMDDGDVLFLFLPAFHYLRNKSNSSNGDYDDDGGGGSNPGRPWPFVFATVGPFLLRDDGHLYAHPCWGL